MDNQKHIDMNDADVEIEPLDDFIELSEEDFYPPADNRVLKSGISDIYGGDNFADYSEYFFDLNEEENYD